MDCFPSSKLWKVRQQTHRVRHETGRIEMRVVKLCEGRAPSGGVAGEATATPRAA